MLVRKKRRVDNTLSVLPHMSLNGESVSLHTSLLDLQLSDDTLSPRHAKWERIDSDGDAVTL